MNFAIIYEKIEDEDFPEGYYYAHIPLYNLTTHGFGIDGAKEAAKDLIKLWIQDNNIDVKNKEYMLSTVEI
jgi:predicted RNase H-like HicB family nuclease